MSTLKGSSVIVIITTLMITCFSKSASAQALDWWEANKPETLYLTQLALADSMRFLNEFEYPFFLVLSKEEKEEYSQIASQYDRKFHIHDYIKKNNENPLLPVNYWLLEFLGRYEHARKVYALEEPPYIDVRGEYYIKFGEPDSKFEEKSGYLQVGKRGNAYYAKGWYRTIKAYQNESWSYANDVNNFIVHFGKFGKKWKQVDRLEKLIQNLRISKRLDYWKVLIRERGVLGSYYGMLPDEIDFLNERNADESPSDILKYWPESRNPLDDPIAELMLQTEVMDKVNLEKAKPDVSTHFSELSELDFDYNLSQFRNPDGRTRIELQLLASIDDLLSKRHNVRAPDSISVEFAFLARNENFDPLFNVPLTTSFDYKKAVDAGLSHAVSTVRFPVQSMAGDLTMQLKDPVSLKMGYKKVPLNIRDYSGDELMVSDIQIYMQPQNDLQKELLPISEVGQFEVTPYPHRDILSYMPMTCYFEVYNIMQSGIIAEYDIDISVTRIELSMFERLKKLIRNTENYTTTLKRTRQVDGNDSSELIEFDISSLKKGKYILEVVIKDKHNKNNTTSVSRKIDIVSY